MVCGWIKYITVAGSYIMVIIAYLMYENTLIATNIILKEGYIMGCNLLDGTNMTLCVRDLQCSAICLPCITGQIELDMILCISRSMARYDICKINNVSLFL